MVKNKKIGLMCMAGVFTALVFVVTAYLHIPTYNGYIHIGDALIYLAACLLPRSYAMAVGAGGAFLADCLTGYAMWAPGSVIIKALTAALFSSRRNKIITLRNALMLLPAALLCVGGYYLYEVLLYGNYITAFVDGVPASIMQSAASTIVFVVVGYALDQINVKSKINGGNH